MTENGQFGAPFLTPKIPEKVYVGPLLRSFPGDEPHNFFWGAEIGGGFKNMTATDVTGFDAIFSTGFFSLLSPDFRGLLLLNCT